MRPFTYSRATSLDQAISESGHPHSAIMAGGTTLVDLMRGDLAGADQVIDIAHIPGLAEIEVEGETLRFGALARMADVAENTFLKRNYPALVESLQLAASQQIRNAATLGGNICNASPAGDTLVPLLAQDARVELVSKPDGALFRRSMPIAEFFVGPGKTRRAPVELLAGVSIPLPPKNYVGRFFKFGTRPALDISTISIGFGGVLEGGILSRVRVAFGAVAATPVRALATEAALEGRALTAATIAAAAAAARDEVTPIDDVRATAWYRKELIHNMTKRILDHVAQA